MARANALAQAAHACDCRSRQQDGPDCLGTSGERRHLPGSGRGGIVARSEVVEDVGRSNGRYGATVDENGIGKTSSGQSASSAR